jgi:epoxide hydrolase-like predicted phosphatase
MPLPYKSVVFDYGGVLINPITGPIATLAAQLGVDSADLVHVLLGPMMESTPDHPWHRAERGEIAVADMQSLAGPWALEKGFELRGDEYEQIMTAAYTVRSSVVEGVGALRAKGYQTALLTNSFREFRHVIDAAVPMSLFSAVIDSSEVGCRKPEPRIYEVVCEHLGHGPAELVYIDDFIGNIEGARRMGWRAEHIASEADVLAVIDELLAAD